MFIRFKRSRLQRLLSKTTGTSEQWWGQFFWISEPGMWAPFQRPGPQQAAANAFCTHPAARGSVVPRRSSSHPSWPLPAIPSPPFKIPRSELAVWNVFVLFPGEVMEVRWEPFLAACARWLWAPATSDASGVCVRHSHSLWSLAICTPKKFGSSGLSRLNVVVIQEFSFLFKTSCLWDSC